MTNGLACIARLDYDSRDQLVEGVRRMRFMLALPNISASRFAMRRFRTVRGWHVELYSNLRLSKSQIVALQAVLGSDFRREGFNLFRVVSLPLAPRFWRYLPHWNILHKEKLG